jgi:2-hydroxycyclohexanecarboxyl-CoA dehydrogenase
MRGLEGKRAVVTGGGGGIGTAICRRFAEEGVTVAVLDIDEEAARHTAAALAEVGPAGIPYVVDITSAESVDAVVADFEERHGPIDILVNNAGWDAAKPFVETDPAHWDRVIAVNLVGPLNLHRAIVPGMKERGTGRIVNISSDAGRVGSSDQAVYSACKGAIISFSKALARELASRQIPVNVVSPGPTDTAFFADFADGIAGGEKLRHALERAIPFRRLGQPEDVAPTVVFLASEEAGFITGQVISVSGGLTMAG